MNEQGSVVEKSHLQDSIGSSADAHLELLRLLERHPEYSQRELAAVLDVSLGKTHYLLKALLEKGWVKVNNFRRSGNKLAYAYLLTPAGLKAKIQLTRSFLLRREAEFERLQREIAELKQELSERPEAP